MAKLHLRNDPIIMTLKRVGSKATLRALHASGKVTIRTGVGFVAKRVREGLTPTQIASLWRGDDINNLVHIAEGVDMDKPVRV